MYLYSVNDNTIRARKWAWCSKALTHGYPALATCPQCHRFTLMVNDKYPIWPMEGIIEGGQQFPDILGCGSYPFLIVSERVLKSWQSSGFTGYCAYPFRITETIKSRVHINECPNYFHLQVVGRIERDLKAMGETDSSRCETCKAPFKVQYPFPRLCFVPNTWDGSDLCVSDLHPFATLCTERVLVNAGQNSWTNFQFLDADDSHRADIKGIDYVWLAKRMR